MKKMNFLKDPRFRYGSLSTLILCLLLMAASLLYQRFLTNREEDDWQYM